MPLTTRCTYRRRLFPVNAQRRLLPKLYRLDAPAAGIAPGAAPSLMLDLAVPRTPPSGFRLKLF